jgi:hypothetical protein
MFEEIGHFDDSRDSLVEFLGQVKQFIMQIAFERYLYRVNWRSERALVFDAEHLRLYADAVREYRDSGRFETLLEAVRDLSDDAIEAGGLGGAQLFLKRETVRVSERRFLARPFRGLFKRLLEAIDVLLKSIIGATGAGSALEELKDLAGLLPEAR